ncbi:hypothetical protein BC628DRAFT_1071419 [Trametes gibbosa]|nr:hypothetical protein BC628DRAFT_1071419 [Trametes gibbosa]
MALGFIYALGFEPTDSPGVCGAPVQSIRLPFWTGGMVVFIYPFGKAKWWRSQRSEWGTSHHFHVAAAFLHMTCVTRKHSLEDGLLTSSYEAEHAESLPGRSYSSEPWFVATTISNAQVSWTSLPIHRKT